MRVVLHEHDGSAFFLAQPLAFVHAAVGFSQQLLGVRAIFREVGDADAD